MYLSIAAAAVLPAPMARITVAAPVTASPPAYTPSMEVRPCSSAMIWPRFCGLKTWRGGFQQRVRGSTEGHDNAYRHRNIEFAALNDDRAASAGSVRLAELHLYAATCRRPSRSSGHAGRRRPSVKSLPGSSASWKMMPSSFACSTSSLRAGSSAIAAAVDDVHVLRAETLCGIVAASMATLPPPTTATLFACWIGVVDIIAVSLHQVDCG